MEGASFEQIFMLLSMLVLRLLFSIGCLFIAQCTEIQRISTWKKYNSFQIFKSKSHEKWNEHGNHYSNKFFFFFFFFFYVFSMLIFKPALNVPLLDGKFSNIQIIFKSHRKMEGVRSKILLLLFLLCFFLCWY